MGTGAAYSAYNNLFSGAYDNYLGHYVGNLFNDYETYLSTPLGASYQNALSQLEEPSHYKPWDPMPDFAAPMISTINSMIYNGGTMDGFSMTSGGIVSFDYTYLGITDGHSDWQNPLSGEIIQESIFTVAVAHTANLSLSYFSNVEPLTHDGENTNSAFGTMTATLALTSSLSELPPIAFGVLIVGSGFALFQALNSSNGNQSYPGPWSYTYEHTSQNPLNNSPQGGGEPNGKLPSWIKWTIGSKLAYELYNEYGDRLNSQSPLQYFTEPRDNTNVTPKVLPYGWR